MSIFKKIVKNLLPYYIVKKYESQSFERNSKKVFNEYYIPKYGKVNFSKAEKIKKIIYMADGRLVAGGLADRLRGMVSLYKISKELNIGYKINMTSPVDLSNYLIPNKHNWLINNDEIVYDTRESTICTFYTTDTTKKLLQETLCRLLKKYNQIHITTNIDISRGEYAKLFNELFNPSDELREKIEYHLSKIGSEFISATFRFQQLLGDFSEANFLVLSDTEKAILINRCIEHLMEIYKENNCKKILVTSDSITFLNKVKEIDFVYIIPGEVKHIDYSLKLEKDAYMKSFLDYFLLTYSKMIYLVVDGQMYDSGFTYTAALYKSPYIIKRY